MQISIPTINLFPSRSYSYINHAAALSRTSTLLDAIAEARQDERSKIGCELHDNVGQLLVTSRLLLSVMKSDPEQRGEVLPQALDLIEQTIREIRIISSEMTGGEQKQRDLEEELAVLADQVRLASGVEVVFECKGIAGQKLTADQHVHLFRIVQESISNALKHAEATRIEIRLLQANNAIELEICDNGKGFDTVCAKKGMGLQSMLKRISQLNATHKLVSAPGAGTSLFILLLLAGEARVVSEAARQLVIR
jgi:signal transduction histidine kinase